MAIYRGAGGPGDATTDAANEATVASNKATEAAASAAAAAASASTASTAATSASSSASSASTSATSAASSASAASSSASSASSSATAAANSAIAAAASQVAAETAKTNAETAATDAENAALSATTSANAASASASSASSSAASASASADAALAALDSFDDRYLGQKASDPTLDNDGNALVAGALYFNTTSSIMKVYDGSSWLSAYSSSAGTLNDLTDVVITSPTTNQLLKYDGTNWVNGTVVTDLVGDTTPQLGGALDTNGYAINFGDNDKATFGDSEDLWLYHDGGTSYLFDRGTGNLRIVTNSTVSIDGASGGEFMAQFVTNGAVSLYYDNSNKFQTTSTGVNVNGTVTATGGNSGNWNTAYGWGDHAAAGYLTSETYTGTVTSVDMTVPTGLSVSGNPVTSSGTLAVSYATGYSIPTNSSQSSWNDAYSFTASFPTQSGNTGKYLTTDGSALSWATVDALPSQTGNNGKFLTTDGTDASWAEIATGNTTATGIWENANTISADYTVTTNYNAMSVGPITVASGVTVTIPSGSTWVII